MESIVDHIPFSKADVWCQNTAALYCQLFSCLNRQRSICNISMEISLHLGPLNFMIRCKDDFPQDQVQIFEQLLIEARHFMKHVDFFSILLDHKKKTSLVAVIIRG